MSKKEIYFINIENKLIKFLVIICSAVAVLLAITLVIIICLPVIIATSAIVIFSIVFALVGVLFILPIAIIINKKLKNKK